MGDSGLHLQNPKQDASGNAKGGGKGKGKGGSKGGKGVNGRNSTTNSQEGVHPKEKELGDEAENDGPESHSMQLFKKMYPGSKRFAEPAEVPLPIALNRAAAQQRTCEQKLDKIAKKARELAKSLELYKEQAVLATEELETCKTVVDDLKIKVSAEAPERVQFKLGLPPLSALAAEVCTENPLLGEMRKAVEQAWAPLQQVWLVYEEKEKELLAAKAQSSTDIKDTADAEAKPVGDAASDSAMAAPSPALAATTLQAKAAAAQKEKEEKLDAMEKGFLLEAHREAAARKKARHEELAKKRSSG